ncbi:MAG: hypothetical protein DMF94_26005 [Acidobacteria bacterium]|nr:MAG: hypothetical protein DMF94_26005 [Acidobacteriota bacterium]
MTSDQRRRVRDLFEAALDRDPPAGAGSWIAREAADDPVVRDEVLSLVEHHSRAGAFLSHPIVEQAADLLLDEEPLAPGASVGAYTIVREIGRGGMGRVYLASDGRLGRTVALKALAPHLTRDPSQRARLRREARAAAALTHPGICTVYALEEVNGELYIATEFVDGHTLAEEIRSGPRPSAGVVLQTAQDLAAALASAHASGVIHRDLKPQPGVVIGTPAYMAPEQINGLAVDARADVFAFGVLLYEFACGAHPFEGSSQLAVMARVLESDARPIAARCPALSGGVADVISRCLKKAPAERFGSAAELVGALKAAGDAGSAASPHATWWRVHQIVIAMLHIVAATLAWQIKEWIETPLTIAIFLALGAAATIAPVLRGHLVFTEVMNRPHLARERRRTGRATLLLDLVTGVLLFIDAGMIAGTRALPAVFALSLAIGIVMASIVLEPATTAAAFGSDGS